MDTPIRITVIIAVLNAADTLARSLDSVAAQTHPDVELIVMDGGSGDGSCGIIERYRPHVAFFESKPDKGVYHAWNKALKRATGQWITFLGADDRFTGPEVLADLVPHLERAEADGVRVVYPKALKVDEKGNALGELGKPWPKVRGFMRHGMALPHPGMMHHASLFSEHGLFDDSFRICGDYEFLLREVLKKPARFVPEITAVAHTTGGLAQASGMRTHLEIHKARMKHGLPLFSPIWCAVFLRAVLRRALAKVRDNLRKGRDGQRRALKSRITSK